MVENVPSSVGYIRVNARGITAFADSVDGGERPDAEPMIGTVKITPSIGTRPIVAIKEDPKMFLALNEITAYLDDQGHLRPPDDGEDGFLVEGGELILVAPDQPENISVFGWSWTAQFRPAEGQRWDGFTVNFRGAPDESIDLVEEYLEGEGRSRGAFSPLIHKIPGPYTPGVDRVPVGVKAGEYLLDESTGDFYLVQSETTTDFLLNVLWSAERLYEMKDVDVADRKNNDMLVYNGATGKWIPKPQPSIPTTTRALSDVSNTVPKAREMLVYNAATKTWDPEPIPKIYEELAELKDVSINQPSEGEVLTWNDVGQKWEATPLPAMPFIPKSIEDLDNVSNSNIAPGKVLAWGGSEWEPHELPNSLRELLDTSISTSIPSRDALIWNGSSWVNQSIPRSIEQLDDTQISSPAPGHYLTYSGGRWVNAALPPVNQPDAMKFVKHGTNANHARPSGTAPVYWVGDAEPTNYVEGDIWSGSLSLWS